LGGLIDNKVSSTVYKIPCLGDIPGLGYLFSNRGKTSTKTNLYVFLTPKVIQTSAEARKIYKSKRDEIEAIQEENIKLYRKREPGVELPETEENRIESFDYREESSSDDATMENSRRPSQPVPPSETVAAPPPTDQSAETIAPEPPAADPNPAPSAAAPMEPERSTQPQPQGAADSAPIESTDQPQTVSSNRPIPADTQQPPTATADTVPSKGYTVQVVSVQSAQRAENILKQLTSRGYAAYTVQTQVNGKPWYRLRIGYYDRRDQAQDLMTRLQADNFDPVLIQF
jgi:general secretion pathway protein D